MKNAKLKLEGASLSTLAAISKDPKDMDCNKRYLNTVECGTQLGKMFISSG
jgi:hypothetical protein